MRDDFTNTRYTAVFLVDVTVAPLVFLPREAAMLARSWDRDFVRPSVCLSVTRVLCDEMKQHTVDISIAHERVINICWWAISPSPENCAT